MPLRKLGPFGIILGIDKSSKMNYLKKILRDNKITKSFYFLIVKGRRAIKSKTGLLKRLRLLLSFCKDYAQYVKNNTNKNFKISPEFLFPCLFDNTDSTLLDYTYFYQDAWCARKIFENKPEHHYDIGSEAKMVGIISQFTKTTMLDIRSIDIELEGLSFQKADVLQTGIPDNSIDSLSSICVLEHIGLGRYGDKIDFFGSEKATTEVKRILAPGGNLYISLPVDSQNRIYFNAHRAFTRLYILEMFAPLKLIEEKYIYGKRMFNEYDASRGFGTGMFHFKKQ